MDSLTDHTWHVCQQGGRGVLGLKLEGRWMGVIVVHPSSVKQDWLLSPQDERIC
jgi:hypothetical protein